jgi:hypothetical protein
MIKSHLGHIFLLLLAVVSRLHIVRITLIFFLYFWKMKLLLVKLVWYEIKVLHCHHICICQFLIISYTVYGYVYDIHTRFKTLPAMVNFLMLSNWKLNKMFTILFYILKNITISYQKLNIFQSCIGPFIQQC